MNETIIQATDIRRTFGSGPSAVTALNRANLSIRPGSLTALKGRSGSGKTTLINLLGALDRPNEGRIVFAGNEITAMKDRQRNELRRTEIGLIFQSFALFPLMSAYENVEFALRVAGADPKRHKESAVEALEFLGMKTRMKHRPFELSGGEQQRVAIARAIAHKPKLILADEPTAELDSRMGLQVMKIFKDLVRKEGMTIILTTHDPAVMEIADQVFVLEDGHIGEQDVASYR